MSDASTGQFPRKVKVAAWGFLGFMAVAGAGIYTVASLEGKAQDMAQSMGGTAEINGYEWHEGGIAAAEVVLAFPQGNFTLTSVKQGDEVTFETLSFDHSQAGPLMKAGEGAVSVSGFDRMTLSLSNIRSSSKDYPLFAGLGDRAVDLDASMIRDQQDYLGSLSVDMANSGSFSADTHIEVPDSTQEIENKSQFQTVIAASAVQSANISYRDNGAFTEFLEAFAEQEGMTPVELKRSLFMGIQGSLIPNQFKGPLQSFISEPGEISVSASPKGIFEKTPIAAMPMQLQAAMMRGATTASLSQDLGLTLSYLPK